MSSEFNTCIGDFATYWGGQSPPKAHGLWFDNAGTLKIIDMSGDTNEKFTYTYTTTEAFYNRLMAFFDAKAPVPASLPNGFATGSFHFFALQQAIAEGAVESAMLSTILAVVVLLVMTRRLFSSLFAAVMIACIVSSVTGIFVLQGWELNVIESVVFSLSVGLACDFVAHLAHSYNHIPYDKAVSLEWPSDMVQLGEHLEMSKHKATGAIKELGVTVFMGFLTTFTAGVCLLLGRIFFFQQFGTFLVALMAFSFTYSLCALMPLIASCGWVDRIVAFKSNRWYQEKKEQWLKKNE